MDNQLLPPNLTPNPLQNTKEGDLSVSALLSNLKRKWKPSAFIALTVFAWLTFTNLKQKPIYQSSMKMMVNTQEASAIGFNYYSYRSIDTEIAFLTSYPVLEKAVAILKNDIPGITIGELQGSLSVGRGETQDILTISYKDGVPEKTKKVLDVMAQIYIDYSIERQRSKADKGLEFVEYQLPKAELELEKISREIRSFQERFNVLNPDVYANATYGSKEALQRQIEEMELKLKLAREERNNRERQLRETGYTKPINMADIVVSDDSLYGRLEGLLNENDIKLNLEQTKYNENYPVLETAKLQQETLDELLSKRKGKVLKEVNTPQGFEDVESMSNLQRNLAVQLVDQNRNIEILETQIVSLRNLYSKAEQKFDQAPELQKVYEELKRQERIKESTVNFLINKLRDLAISQAQEASPWQVLQPAAIPSAPISPNVRRSIMVSLVSGLLTAIATALVLDLLDQRIKRVDEVKELTRLPVLGVVPTVGQPFVRLHSLDSDSTPVTGNSYYYKDSSFTEAIRAFAINLRYLVANTGVGKVIAITSSRPAEGKSTISHNLSLILAELGFKILIVDADMRKPTIHKLSKNKSNEKGLSSIISGNEHISEVIQKGKLDKLDIITSGPTPPNPVALLDSPLFEQMIDQWREDYDYVIIDTPPLGISADTVTIANKVDTVLLSVGMEKVTRQMLTNSIETLNANNVNIGGTIVNLISSRDEYANYYSYYYYYNNSGQSTVSTQTSDKGMERFLNYFRRR